MYNSTVSPQVTMQALMEPAPGYLPEKQQFPTTEGHQAQFQRPASVIQSPPSYQQLVPGPAIPSQQQHQDLQQILQHLPPEKLLAIQQIAAQQPQQPQWAAPPVTLSSDPSSSMTFSPPPLSSTLSVTGSSKHRKSDSHVNDEKQTGKVQRFFGDTLVGRFARASVQTASSALKMPAALSPWGDNNPVTLPNVRYRDAALFTTFAFVGAPLIEGADGLVSDIFGADSFVSEIVSSGAGAVVGSTVLKYGVFQIVEQAIDKGILEHMLPEEEKMIQTTNVKVGRNQLTTDEDRYLPANNVLCSVSSSRYQTQTDGRGC